MIKSPKSPRPAAPRLKARTTKSAKVARPKAPFATIEAAVAAYRRGEILIVVDDEDRENEGDLTIAAEHVTPDAINFMMTHGRGLICMPMTAERLDALNIPLQVPQQMNSTQFETAFCIGIEAKRGTSTGISAQDRARTVLTAIDKKTKPGDLARPGHIFPLRARDGGVLVRAGQTEAAVDLSRMAGLQPAGVICEIAKKDGTMARVPELAKFARKHKLLMVTVADLIRHRMQTEGLVEKAAEADLPTELGPFRIHAYNSLLDGTTHTALVAGDISSGRDVLVRVHSKCLTGDVFHSARCDCGDQLDAAMRRISAEGRGLANKIRAYALQDQGFDTVEANEKLGFKPDQRDYGIGAQILRHLGVRTMRLLTNNPRKFLGLQGYGLSVSSTLPLEIAASDTTRKYLKVKKDKLGHRLKSV